MSRSSSVNTVSRCMCARSFVMTHGDHPLRRALGEQGLGDLLDHPPWERSLMPIATVPLPIGITSPPSSEARPKSSVSKRPSSPQRRVPELEVGLGEHRVVAVDRGDVVGLAAAGRPVHRVDRHAAVDPARRVAGEQRVRQRRQHERCSRRRGRRAMSDDFAQRGEVEAGLGDRQPADEVRGELRPASGRRAVADLVDQRPADGVLRRDQLDQPAGGRRRWRPAPRRAGR